MKKYFSLLIVFFAIMHVKAQKTCMEANYQYNNNKLKIRWVLSDYISWKSAIKNGIQIEKVTLNNDLNIAETKTIFNALKPATLDELKKQFDKNNSYAGIAAQMLYGKSTVVDDGNFGTFLKHKKNEQDLKHSIAMFSAALDFNVAKAIALGYEEEVQPNKNYIYKLIINGATCDTFYLLVNTFEVTPETKISATLNATPSEKSVILNWNATQDDIIGYYLEKSPANSDKFTRINQQPFVLIENKYNKETLQHIDSLEKNYQPFKYRLIGVNAYGEETKPSPIIEAMGKDVTAPSQPNITKIDVKTNEMLIVHWNQNAKEKDLIGFNVLRAPNIDGPFTKQNSTLIKITETIYHDLKPNIGGNNFYIIEAIDTAGNTSNSLPMQGIMTDTIAPRCPTIISQTKISDGLVVLNWQKPTALDVMGYRVYFSNSNTHVFTMASKSILYDTVFYDNLNINTLTTKAYYKVQALDFSYNESKNCPSIEIIRKDTIKPENALLTQVSIVDNGFKVEWIPSTSKDAENVLVKRRNNTLNKWETIYTGNNFTDSLFIDNNITFNQRYEYAICTIDLSGNSTPLSKPFAVINKKSIQLKGTSNLKITNFNGQYKLTWDRVLAEDEWFIIYQTTDNGQTVNVIDKQLLNEFILPKRFCSASYSFGVSVINKNGKQSKIDNWVTIKTE